MSAPTGVTSGRRLYRVDSPLSPLRVAGGYCGRSGRPDAPDGRDRAGRGDVVVLAWLPLSVAASVTLVVGMLLLTAVCWIVLG